MFPVKTRAGKITGTNDKIQMNRTGSTPQQTDSYQMIAGKGGCPHSKYIGGVPMAVKIVGISGSPRSAATEYALKQALEAAGEVEGVETSFYSLKGRRLNFCIHCDRCVNEGADRCVIYKDDMNELYDPFYEADGYIIASPVYEMGVTGQLLQSLLRSQAWSWHNSEPQLLPVPILHLWESWAAAWQS